MNWLILLDAPSAAIVGGGTLAATVLRSGLGDCRATAAQLVRPRFDAAATRAELAGQVREIRREGMLRAPPRRFADPDTAEASDALLRCRSLAALVERNAALRTKRAAAADRAVRTLAQGAELAPVFGLAGTLISLSQLSLGAGAGDGFGGAIAMAVVTTLYGLVLANFALAPLARMVERAAQREERERQALVDWLAAQLAEEVPGERQPAPARAAA